MRRTFAAFVILVLIAPAIGLAQSPFAEQSIRNAVNRHAVRLSAPPTAAQSQPTPERSWPGRHPVLFGALLGFGIGVGVQFAVIPGASGGEPHSVYLPMFGGVGAGIGALTGLFVSAARR